MLGETIPLFPKKSSDQDIADPASFRDPRGFVFFESGQPFRQISASGQASYGQLMTSGLYENLVKDGLLVRHEEVSRKNGITVIKPDKVVFISYPYEWSFSQLKDAALLTLEIQKRALAKNMSLIDASAYNVQFVSGKPILIDTLSLEPYQGGEPWHGYRQFCQHFLAPLALMSYTDVELGRLLQVYLDGIPLPLASRLLPWQAKVRTGLAIHLSWHARMQRERGGSHKKQSAQVSKTALTGIVSSLSRTVEALRPPDSPTVWGKYYSQTNYTDASFEEKAAMVKRFIKQVAPKRVLDLGSNNGFFSRVAAAKAAELVISADVDPAAVEDNYQKVKAGQEKNLLPLLIDLTSPSPALGWENRERRAFGERAKADVMMALALVHHLAIANNVPLDRIAKYFADLAPALIVEFVPKSDSQTRKLLASREDVFDDYSEAGFEEGFGKYFVLVQKERLKGAERTMYLMKRK